MKKILLRIIFFLGINTLAISIYSLNFELNNFLGSLLLWPILFLKWFGLIAALPIVFLIMWLMVYLSFLAETKISNNATKFRENLVSSLKWTTLPFVLYIIFAIAMLTIFGAGT